MPRLQWHISEGVSVKLWRYLWLLKGLKLTLNWKSYRKPTGSCMPKILLVTGRKKVLICFLRISKDGTSSKCLIKFYSRKQLHQGRNYSCICLIYTLFHEKCYWAVLYSLEVVSHLDKHYLGMGYPCILYN